MSLFNQTTVRDRMPVALEGQIADLNTKRVRTLVNSSKQRATFTVTAADTSTTITINGTGYTEAAGGGETKAEIAISVAGLINAGESAVTATPSGDTVIVESDASASAFTYAATANCTVVLDVNNQGTAKFGRFVVLDANNNDKAHLPSLAAQITDVKRAAGFTCLTQSRETQTSGGYVIDTAMNVLESGTIWVKTETAVAVGDAVYVRFTSGAGGSDIGLVRNDADTSTAAALPSARFEESASAGEIVRITINLP